MSKISYSSGHRMKEEGKERKLRDGRATARSGAADLDRARSLDHVLDRWLFKLSSFKHGHTVLFEYYSGAQHSRHSHSRASARDFRTLFGCYQALRGLFKIPDDRN